MKLAVIASHPVQYQAPLFRELSGRVEIMVLYAYLPEARVQGEGFGVDFQWDVPVLGGYPHEVVAQAMAGRATPAGLAAAFGGFLSRLRAFSPDAILSTGWHHPSMFAGIAAAVVSGCPRLLRCEANLLRPRSAGARIFHLAMLSHYRAVLPIGAANRRYYRAFGVGDRRMFDSPYFIENQRFAAASAGADRSALRARWGIPADAFCFLFSGKLVEKKHPEAVVGAMAGLPGAHLLIAGSGELEDRVRASALACGVGCSFAGFLNQSEIPLAYAAADCLVLPSDAGETWGLVVNEAMACGIPAIVSDRVGCREDLIVEGETGFSFPFGDTAVLAEKMRVVASVPVLAGRMGANARELVARYSAANAADGVVRAMRKVCGEGG
jgi:glycosyltransferase involved in cell wall biosynthesis